jgi:hypothetical protein
MKQTEIITGGVEKINPMKVLTYDEAHEKVKKIQRGAYKDVSSVHREAFMKAEIVPRGLVERAKEATEKMVKKR